MEDRINACTLANDVQFHFTLVSVSSFIETNPWFTGTIYLFIAPAFSLSDQNFNKLKLVYPNLEKIMMNGAPNNPVEAMKKSAILLQRISDYSRVFAFLFGQENLIYFSNTCLFMREISPILNKDMISFTPEKSIIHIASKNPAYYTLLKNIKNNLIPDSLFAEDGVSQVSSMVLNAVEVKDNKFVQLKEKINSASCIYYSLHSLEDSQYVKIKQVWLHANKIINQKLISPRNFNINVIPNHVDPENPFNRKPEILKEKTVHESISETSLISTQELKKYLDNKKIAVIANSAELLKFNYGKLIDSHDIIVRFNGYVIDPPYTGSKTNVHCIFREAKFNLEKVSDYLVVFSKPLPPWKKSVDALKSEYPNKKIINYNFPNSTTILRSFRQAIVPTSGLAWILLIDELNITNYQLTLFGFNCYQNGQLSVLRSNDSNTICQIHEYSIEQAYLKRHFNEISPEVLQKNKRR